MLSEGNLGLMISTIIELPVESLALAVLENYANAHSWNRDNWLIAAQHTLGRGPHINALAEAWAWLEARALVIASSRPVGHKRADCDPGWQTSYPTGISSRDSRR